MLPRILENNSNTEYKNDDNWKKYLIKIGKYSDCLDLDFLSQICYEHYDDFNLNFPKFSIKKHKVVRIKISTAEIYENVRFEDSKPINFYNFQVDEFIESEKRNDYQNLKYTIENGTWGFPPVIIKYELAKKLGCKKAGMPIYLIEGNHRVSFINRLYELKRINDNFKHEFLIIKEK